MEADMSTTIVDEANPVAHIDALFFGHRLEALHPETGRLTRFRRRAFSAAPRQARDVDAGIPVVDERMRLPSFVETCPHISDKIIPLNGGRFNVDHYLRVLRAKAESDASFAMALTVRPL